MSQVIKLGNEAVDASAVANSWYNRDGEIMFMLKSQVERCYIDMGSRDRARQGFEELVKAMRNEPFKDVEYDSGTSTSPDQRITIDTFLKRAVLTLALVGLAVYFVSKVL